MVSILSAVSSMRGPKAKRTPFDATRCKVRSRGLVAGVLAAAALDMSVASVVRAEPVIGETRIEAARGVGMGSGARANSAATQALADNPANLPLGGLYHIEAFMGYQPSLKRISAGGAVADSMTSRLAAGFSMRGLFGDNDAGDNAGYDGRLGLGLPLGDMFSLGLAGRYANLKVSDPKARPERTPLADELPDRTFKLKAFTMDAAITLRPLEGLSIAGLAYNLIDTESPLAPLLVGGSVGYGRQQISLGVDALVDVNTHKMFSGPKLQIGGGIEFLAQGVIPLRAGYLYDQGRHLHAVTGGLGYVDTRFGLQISLRQAVAPHSDTTIFTALQYFVQ